MLSHVRLFVTPRTVAFQAPLSLGFFFFFPDKNTGAVCISYSRGSSRPRDWTHISRVFCFAGRLPTTAPPGKSQNIHRILNNTEWNFRLVKSELSSKTEIVDSLMTSFYVPHSTDKLCSSTNLWSPWTQGMQGRTKQTCREVEMMWEKALYYNELK